MRALERLFVTADVESRMAPLRTLGLTIKVTSRTSSGHCAPFPAGPPELGSPGARFALTLTADPYSTQAENLVPGLRQVAHAASPTALVGGPTAQQKDFDTAAADDNRLIVPSVLLLVFVILALLLHAITLPPLLVAIAILSFGAALGISSAVFDHLLGYPSEPATLPLLAFIFLVALGVDYNIFLMARASEEALRRRDTWTRSSTAGASRRSAGATQTPRPDTRRCAITLPSTRVVSTRLGWMTSAFKPSKATSTEGGSPPI